MSDPSKNPEPVKAADANIDRRAELLVAYDSALIAGRPHRNSTKDGSSLATEGLAEDLACLELLHRVWGPPPSSNMNEASVESFADESIQDCPRRVGRFEVIRKLGHGGYGIVLLALDPHLGRQVAIKIPRPEVLVSPVLRERFLREAEAAGRLDHPNLVPVFEVGEDGPLWYIAASYISGGTLAEWVAALPQRLPPTLAAALVAQLADGVQHAHAAGILHRDLKPGNVLMQPVAEATGTAASSNHSVLGFVPRLTDFGLAKLLDGDTEQTASGALLGTPAYMAPEQATGHVHQISAATDVYGLGAILYELLTRRPPFCAANSIEMLRCVVQDEVVTPRRLRRDVARDLEAICLKCLEKQPSRRYRTCAELAADLRRYLAGEPIQARSATPVERLVKWTRRHPTAAALWVSAAISLATLIVGTGLSNRWLREERDRTLEALTKSQASERRALRHAYASDIKRAQEAMLNLDIAQCVNLLKPYASSEGEEDLRDFSWNFLWRALHRDVRRLPRHPGAVYALAFSPDGRLLATACADGKTRIWEYATLSLEAVLEGHQGEVNAVTFSADGTRLATGGDDGQVIVWDVVLRRPLKHFHHSGVNERPVSSVLFSPDGRQLYNAGGWYLFHWDLDTGRQSHRVQVQERDIRSMSLSDDGGLLAATAVRVKVYRTDTWEPQSLPIDYDSTSRTAVQFLPDSRQMVAGSDIGSVTSFDYTTGERPKNRRFTPLRRINSLSYDQKSGVLAACSDSRVVAAGSLNPDRRVEAVMLGHTDRVWDVKFAPDGNTLVSASGDGNVFEWRRPDDVCSHRADGLLTVHEAGDDRTLRTLSYSHDGQFLVCAGDLGHLSLIDRQSNQIVDLPNSGMATAVDFLPSDKQIVYGSAVGDRKLLIYDLDSRTSTPIASLVDGFTSLSVSPRGDLVAVACGNRTRVFELPSRRELRPLPTTNHALTGIAFSPNADSLVILSGSELSIYDTTTWQRSLSVIGAEGQFLDVDYFPDGKRIAVAEGLRSVVIRDAATGQEIAQLSGHPGKADSVAVSPDGCNIASVCDQHVMQIWDERTGQSMLQFTDVQSQAGEIQFSPRGGELAIVQDRAVSSLLILDGRPIEVAEPPPSIPASESGR